MPVHIALLRGINVGGRNKLAMKDLVTMFEEAGCSGVRTYIQSGNVVFDATPPLARRIGAVVRQLLADRLELDIPVVTRTAAQLSEITRANPFLRSGADDKTLHVAFLADRPGPARVAALDPDRSTPDRLAVRGREIYLHCPNGIARTRYTNAYLDSALGTTCTFRNWRTTLKLVDLAAG